MRDDEAIVRYLTHTDVVIDPNIPVPQWRLSAIGRARAEMAARAEWLRDTTQIVSSAERKAVETAEIIAAALGLEFEIRPRMHENDRSATGVLSQSEFQAMADRFFASPTVSVRGWERAIDAQARIVAEAEEVLSRERPGDVLLVGHGGVGTLLYCHYSGLAIDRKHDQIPGGGGCYYALRKSARTILHGWRRIEA